MKFPIPEKEISRRGYSLYFFRWFSGSVWRETWEEIWLPAFEKIFIRNTPLSMEEQLGAFETEFKS